MPMCALYTSEKTNEETVFVTHDKGTSTVKESLVRLEGIIEKLL
jgi:uncharacterized protein YcgL (UPF0745 family)